MTQRHGGIIGIDHDAGGAGETITTFTSDGIFTPHSTQDVDFLCIAGGGAGAGADAGSGGGGAGGYRSSWQEEPDTHTKLLIHSDTTDGSTTFTDSSGKTVAVAGNTHHETDQKKFGDTSIHFDGTGDYLTLSDSSDFDFDTGNFTIESWIRVSNFSDYRHIFESRTSEGTEGFSFGTDTNSKLFMWYNGSFRITTSTTLSTTTWYHVALVRNGNVHTIYINGTADTNTYTSANTYTSDRCWIGRYYNSTSYMYIGYMDEFRISKGIARYTGNFTAPTAVFSTDTYTKLLIHSGTDDGSTTFTDSSGFGHEITAYGDSHHETDQKKFGDTSIHFDGTGDYLSSTIGALGTADFTIEFWVYNSVLQNYEAYLTTRSTNQGTLSNAWYLGTNSSGNLVFAHGPVDASGGTMSTNTWYHICATRTGDTLSIYIDGTRVDQETSFTRTLSDTAMTVGQNGNGTEPFNGYLDEIRISSINRYGTGSSFTVPTATFPLKEDPLSLTKGTNYQITVGDGGIGGGEDQYYYGLNPIRELSETSRGFGQGHDSAIGPYADSYTKLMIQSYTSDGSTTFTDLSDSAHTITVNGNTHHEEDQHNDFHPTAMYFDGTGDYLQLPTSSDWAMGTADFTVECWFRQDASPGYNADIFDTRVSSRDETTGFAVGIRSNGSFYLYCNGDKPVSTSSLISANTWYHLAVVRHSGNIILFLDGDQKSNYSSATQTFTNTQLKIGRRGDTDANPFQGYLDDIRVSKGVARYISTASGSDNTIYDTVNRIISYGGGRAGSQASGRGSWSGASGGGGTYTSAGAPVSVLGQGYAGGDAVHFGGSGYGGGGGGGASAAGAASTGTNSGGAGDVGGDGGAGRTSTISGSSVTYAGGGGGGHRLAQTNAAEPGDGGAGGGGNGNGGGTHGTDGTGGLHGNGADGTANTGGGGGGSGGTTRSWQGRINDEGGDGGSGIVIMREPAVTSASGVYNMDDVFRYVSDGKW
jgi:hypothetical protein